jgi:3-hydroxyisobutyrate dehydrogenase-like beta-hydroxyacid dehydrogenase
MVMATGQSRAQDHSPGLWAGFFVKLLRKDLRLVTATANQNGISLPGLAMMTSMFNATAALSFREADLRIIGKILSGGWFSHRRQSMIII